MKVLLVGDYSSVHYYLFKGLLEFGIDVALISSGDGNKNIPTETKWNVSPYTKLAKILGVNGKDFFEKNSNILKSLCGFDVVQIINPVMVEEASIRSNLRLFDFLKLNNDKIFLYSCGDDLNWVLASMRRQFEHSMFYEKSLYLSKEMIHPLRYLLNPLISRLCRRVYNGVDGIIPGSNDYLSPITQSEKLRELVPFPIDLSFFPYTRLSKKNKYDIIHGVQPGKRIRKGDKYFEKAVNKSGPSFNYMRVGGLPFRDYIKKLRDGDIFFDQTNSIDQGMNALFAMATGKVVFSGFSNEFYSHYNLKENVGINAKPSVDWLESRLMDVRDSIIDVGDISNQARLFVERIHDFRIVAQKFLTVWSA